MKSQQSKIYRGTVVHSRVGAAAHFFKYPVYFYGFYLDELESLDRRTVGLGYNRHSLASLWDRDYLDRGPEESISVKLSKHLLRSGVLDSIDRIYLVSNPRLLGYVFNPVSFYFCFLSDGHLRAVVAEVNNTFSERHLYVLDQLKKEGSYWVQRGESKAFHVSPFFDMNGTYEFKFSLENERLDIHVNLWKESQPALLAHLNGSALPLNTKNHLSTILRYPLTAALTMPRILSQAWKLYRKGHRVYSKPNPQGENTIREAKPSLLQRIALSFVTDYFKSLKRGRLTLELPEQKIMNFGDAQSALSATIRVHDYSFFSSCLLSGDIGLGEAYQSGTWSSPNLSDVIKVFILNLETAPDRSLLLTKLGRAMNRLRHLSRSNSVENSLKNIRAHYDLSNEFFALFLDPTMTYSCGVFPSSTASLEEAQINKINRILDKARISKDHEILEIGSGWGALAIQAAKRFGCRVHSITLSERQLKVASERAKEAGVDHLVHFELRDYRKLNERRYDRIISVEMLEAVGHEHYESFFRVCDQVLKDNGLMVLQVITIPDHRYEDYRRSVDWIQKYIFPGGLCPSLTAMTQAMTTSSQLQVEALENIGPHYATTIEHWQKRLKARSGEVLALGFDEAFLRTWDYYFCYCQAGFATRALNALQLVITRPLNQNLLS